MEKLKKKIEEIKTRFAEEKENLIVRLERIDNEMLEISAKSKEALQSDNFPLYGEIQLRLDFLENQSKNIKETLTKMETEPLIDEKTYKQLIDEVFTTFQAEDAKKRIELAKLAEKMAEIGDDAGYMIDEADSLLYEIQNDLYKNRDRSLDKNGQPTNLLDLKK